MVRLAIALLGIGVLGGCATNVGQPQTRDEFVSMYNTSGMFHSAEHLTVARPLKAVTADIRDYAKRCLTVRVSHGPNYQLKEAGGSTTYRPKVETARPGVLSLSVQEIYNDRPQGGVPADGMFTLVAELHAAGAKQTQIDVYHLSRGKIAEFLKRWAEGNKGACPALNG